ncbi:MarR family transcriptional regulator [Streptomyces agglomeratus]|uniref:MarR family transcriptional regulator n=1 Tax=Streptomyces agglomeratus TaxID=285458 RepID=A0A1E5P2N8_9ACTN|nr:MarR family transcriptional regulator [Streptomyces agglomeratus]OEJ23796.1 MarR family transcriptional regulator [Streptomyces agglomeratus]OEJ43391.1 MarR family transcriptional regulator [Streptomyces agglomeratus]OEJ54690.1 MarR family transcriptional regulator [Streptomyces agglomeratus]
MPSSSASAQDPRRIASGLAALLPALHRALDRRLVPDLPFPRLPEGQLALLRLVGRRDGITVREAADVLLMKPNNVSALVTQLAGLGLLERRQDAADKRVAHLHLTAEARRRTAAVGELMDGYLIEALHALTDADLDAIGSALGALEGLARHIHPAAD